MNKIVFSLTILIAISSFVFSQNVGIGTNQPVSMLHVNNGTVLLSGLNFLWKQLN